LKLILGGAAVNDLGCRTSIDVVVENVELKGATVVDAGCGSMGFSRELVAQGAHVFAIDPDSVRAVQNREVDERGLVFSEASADSLPVDDNSADGVFFSNSLHHIPAETYPTVFSEVARVLKPGGFLWVIEPVDCPLNTVMKLFNDEEVQRAAAQQVLNSIASPQFASFQQFQYHNFRQFESFEDFATRFAKSSYNNGYTPEDVYSARVSETFHEQGQPDFRFVSPKTVWFGEGFLS